MTGLGTLVVEVVGIVVLAYFLLLALSYLVTTVIAFRYLLRYSRRARAVDLGQPFWAISAPPVTLVVPLHDDVETCVSTIEAVLSLSYPYIEVLAVDDGSTDGTLDRMADRFGLTPTVRVPTADLPSAPVQAVFESRADRRLLVIRKEWGGSKSDALNAGLNYVQTPLFCAIDGDTLIERDALERIVRPFLEDRRTIVAGGVLRVLNGCTVDQGRVSDVRLPRSLLVGFQVVEYLRAFLIGRVGWAEPEMLMVVSGAFGLFRRSAVVEVGGYSHQAIGEDMELVIRLHRRAREHGNGEKITFVPDPVAWTLVPESLGELGRQRDRWQRGLVGSLWLNRRAMLNPRYGRIGLVAMPYYVLLEAIGPLVEVVGYVTFIGAALLGWVSVTYAFVFLGLAIGVGTAHSVAVLAMEELTFRRYERNSDLVRLFGLALLENFGYRQLLSLYRVRGLVSALRGSRKW